MALQGPDGSSKSACCLFGNRRNRVRPISAGTSHSEQVEVRPNRVLRIQHINPQPRDPKFAKEIQLQKQYRSQGIVSAGPLTMPKHKQVQDMKSVGGAMTSAYLPNSVNSVAAPQEISASYSKQQIASATGVVVSMQNIPQDGYTTTNHAPSGHIVEEGKQNGNLNMSQNHIFSLRLKNTPVKVTEPKTALAENSADILFDHHTSSDLFQEQPDRHTCVDDSFADRNGRPSKPTTLLFFIHGVGGSSDVWHAQLRYFARLGFEIIAPDLIGHGMSCTPKDEKVYQFKEIAADMLEVFDRYCKKRNIIIGHSYGCSFAAVLARFRSRRVHKLVMISGGAPIPLAPQPGIFSFPTCMLTCFRPCLNCKFHKSAFHTQRQPIMDTKEAFSIPTYVLQHTMNGQNWPDGDEMFHQWLLCPVLLLYGAQDKLVSLKEEEHMAEIIFCSQLEVIPDASHMVMIEAPEEVNTLLLRFITEDPTMPALSSNPRRPSTQHQLRQEQSDIESEHRSVSRMSTKSYQAVPDSHVK